ncbi:MAG: flavodoxin domain-containing protein [Methanosarcinaceae archaeon]|nr:flavodoxin domain-containing protein [Methanosarcinaceae archaeon]
MLVIIYGTDLHNTERIARAIEEAAKEEGTEKLLKNVDDANIEDVVNPDGIAIGSPNYHDNMMPTFKNFLDKLVDIDLSGKVCLAFGSYGWGTEAIEDIHNILASYGVEMLQKLDVK